MDAEGIVGSAEGIGEHLLTDVVGEAKTLVTKAGDIGENIVEDVKSVLHHAGPVLDNVKLKGLRELRELAADFQDHLGGLGISPEIDVAMTKVEEALLWAAKHLLGE